MTISVAQKILVFRDFSVENWCFVFLIVEVECGNDGGQGGGCSLSIHKLVTLSFSEKKLDPLVKLLISRFTTCANQVPCALVPYVSVASLSNLNRKYRNLYEFLRACFKLRKDTIR